MRISNVEVTTHPTGKFLIAKTHPFFKGDQLDRLHDELKILAGKTNRFSLHGNDPNVPTELVDSLAYFGRFKDFLANYFLEKRLGTKPSRLSKLNSDIILDNTGGARVGADRIHDFDVIIATAGKHAGMDVSPFATEMPADNSPRIDIEGGDTVIYSRDLWHRKKLPFHVPSEELKQVTFLDNYVFN